MIEIEIRDGEGIGGTNHLTGRMVVVSRQITNNFMGQSRQQSNYLTGLSCQIAFPFLKIL